MHHRSIRALFCTALYTIMFATMIACVVLSMSATSFAQVNIAISVGPPAIPVYEQPICPGDGYLWTPGYWAYDYDVSDYYWVPGTWIEAPEVGFLWTPPYWGWGVDRFIFHAGYWGPHIGFYGGINYGFGYFGSGFEGGRWDGGHFFYNRAVMNVNITNIHNTYNTTIINRNDNRVSYNGGRGGIDVHPTPEQEAAEHDRHVGPVEAQTKHMDEARSNPEQRASRNMGRPAIAATDKPGNWKGRGVVPAKEAGAPYKPEDRGGNAGRPDNRPDERAGDNMKPAVHPHDLPAAKHPDAPNTGDANRDRKLQQQQEKMAAKQQQERDKLQQKQDQEHQRAEQQQANDQRRQQMEQRHQQQTSQMQQRHEQQNQHFQERVQRAAPSRGRR